MLPTSDRPEYLLEEIPIPKQDYGIIFQAALQAELLFLAGCIFYTLFSVQLRRRKSQNHFVDVNKMVEGGYHERKLTV